MDAGRLSGQYSQIDRATVQALQSANTDGITADEAQTLKTTAAIDGDLSQGEQALVSRLQELTQDSQSIDLELPEAHFDVADTHFDLTLKTKKEEITARVKTADTLPQVYPNNSDKQALFEQIFVPGETGLREVQQTVDFITKAGVSLDDVETLIQNQYGHSQESMEPANAEDTLASIQGYALIQESLQRPAFASLPEDHPIRLELSTAADALLSGHVRIDEHSTSKLNARAAYSPGLDTVISKRNYPGCTDFKIQRPLHRATLLHELRHLGQDGHSEDHKLESLGEMESHAYLVEGLYMSDEPHSQGLSSTDRRTVQFGRAFTEVQTLDSQMTELNDLLINSHNPDEMKTLLAQIKDLQPKLEQAQERLETAQSRVITMAGGDNSSVSFNGYGAYSEL